MAQNDRGQKQRITKEHAKLELGAPGENKKASNSWRLFIVGAGNETRTRDPNLGKVVLYQLSYSRIWLSGLSIGKKLFRCNWNLKIFFAKTGRPADRPYGKGRITGVLWTLMDGMEEPGTRLFSYIVHQSPYLTLHSSTTSIKSIFLFPHSFSSCMMVPMSLSPRPERLTTMIDSFGISAARFMA